MSHARHINITIIHSAGIWETEEASQTYAVTKALEVELVFQMWPPSERIEEMSSSAVLWSRLGTSAFVKQV